MALSAGDVRSEKGRERVGETVQRHARIAQQIRCRAVLAERAFRSQHLLDHFIPRAIPVQLSFQPGVKGPGLSDTIVAVFHPQHVAQPVEHVRDMPRGGEQFVDQPGTPVLAGVLLKARELLGARNSPNDIEVDAADELVVTCGSIGPQLMTLQVTQDESIDPSRCLCLFCSRSFFSPRLGTVGQAGDETNQRHSSNNSHITCLDSL